MEKGERGDEPVAEVMKVIRVAFRRGKGHSGDPVRFVQVYRMLDGQFLAENDPCAAEYTGDSPSLDRSPNG